MTEATWGLVAGTLILAVVAAWYAFETHRIVDRMDKEREAKDRPTLAFHLVPWGPKTLKLRIQNVGIGAAFALKGDIEGFLNGERVGAYPWSYQVLAPGKYEEFGFPTEPSASPDDRFNMDAVRGRFERVHAYFTYKSASGREYVLDDTIRVRDITAEWIASRMMATQDHPDRLLPRMAKALDEIAKAVAGMGRAGG